MSSTYHDKELDLATTVCDMNGLLLQATGGRSRRRDAEGALGLIKRYGDSADKRKAIGYLVHMRCSDDLAESGGGVLLTEVWDPGVPGLPHGVRAWDRRRLRVRPRRGPGTATERLTVFATTTSRAPPGRRR